MCTSQANLHLAGMGGGGGGGGGGCSVGKHVFSSLKELVTLQGSLPSDVIAIGAMVDRQSTLVKEGRGRAWTCLCVA